MIDMAYIKHFLASKLFIIVALSLFGGLLLFKACQNPQTVETRGILEYKELRYQLPLDLPDSIPTDINTTVYRVDYVKFNEDTLNQWITKYLVLNEKAKSIQEDAKILLATQHDQEKLREGEPFPWRVEQKLTVDHNHENYIGLSFEGYQYTGGAHGNFYKIFKHWNPISRQEMAANEFFEESKRVELNAIGETAFRKKFEIAEGTSLADDYFFENGVFSLPENFQILQNGDFNFLYNIYEILPYVNGITELVIPAAEIEPFLSKKGVEILNAIRTGTIQKSKNI